MSNQQTACTPTLDEQIAAVTLARQLLVFRGNDVLMALDAARESLRRLTEPHIPGATDNLNALQQRHDALQRRFDALWSAQDGLREENATQAQRLETARRANNDLRATVERLTRQQAKPVRPPDDDCEPELELDNCRCGWQATLIERERGQLQVACARWRDAEAMAEWPCSMTTGSYASKAEAVRVWNRRCDD